MCRLLRIEFDIRREWTILICDNLWYDGGVVVPHDEHQVVEAGEHLFVRRVLRLTLVVQVSQVVGS